MTNFAGATQSLTADFEDVRGGYDLCIVGAGPAGLTLAAELAHTGLKICVLESGGERRTAFADTLKAAESDRLPIKENSRERVLGGASTVWGGGSAPLDAIDYDKRPWSAGWPYQARDLEPYLEAAAQRYRFPRPTEFSLPPPEFAPHEWQGWSLRGLREKPFIAVRPAYRFAALRSVVEHDGMDLLVRTTVTTLLSEAHTGGRRVTEALCKTPGGKPLRVRARAFVLAAGGIENPRLLLNSNLGNEHDQVGRYFMNHPKGHAGVLRLHRPLSVASPYLMRSVRGHIFFAGLSLPPERQREGGLLNSYVRLESNIGFLQRHLLSFLEHFKLQVPDEQAPLGSFQRYALGIWRLLPSWLAPICSLTRPRTLRLRWYAEMEPRPENRITLSDKKDAFGKALPLVSYALGERDERTLTALYGQVEKEIRRLGLGRLEGSPEAVIAAVGSDASHHLGGTRMGIDPASSVVDPNCRVHSVENLYVAGGSVFPNGGSANPTYTIVALAIKLAEHLQRKLRTSAVPDRPRRERRTEADTRRSKIVIIGAGRRIAGDVLYALRTLKDEFAIEGIYARHTGSLAGEGDAYEVRPLRELAQADLRKTRFAYVAVPPHAVYDVLEMLPGTIEIVLDTPVPLSRRLHRRLRRFAKVHVAEDSVCMPWIADARTQYAPIRRVECRHSVARGHGIAIIKALCGPVRWGWRWGNTIHLRAGAAQVTIAEPRDYRNGRLLINGDDLPVVSRMHEFKRAGLVRMLHALHCGESPWPLDQGRNDSVVDRLMHGLGVYIALR